MVAKGDIFDRLTGVNKPCAGVLWLGAHSKVHAVAAQLYIRLIATRAHFFCAAANDARVDATQGLGDAPLALFGNIASELNSVADQIKTTLPRIAQCVACKARGLTVVTFALTKYVCLGATEKLTLNIGP